MTRKLEGKVALVTGGTTGIGLATVRLFLAEGARVIVTGNNPDSIEAARKELGSGAEVLRSDASDRDAIRALFEDLGRRHGGLDVLVLNAGGAALGPISDFDDARVEEILRLNFVGPWLALKYAAPILRQGGSIVFNTSINNRIGMPGTSVYAASKAALRSLARTAAAELAARGVRVNAVSPGPVETPIYGKLGLPPDMLQGFAQKLQASVPLRRFGRSEEIARAILFLASDDASFITGEELVADGGLTTVAFS